MKRSVELYLTRLGEGDPVIKLALAIVISIILLFLGGLGIKTLLPEQSTNVARPEILLQIRQCPDDQHPEDRGDVIRVRLNIVCLLAYNLSPDDVMKAFVESTIVGSPRRVEPPPGVVFVTRLHSQKLYEQLIVKANAEGQIIRLKDVATVEPVKE